MTPEEWLRRYDAWWGNLLYTEKTAAHEQTARALSALLAAVATMEIKAISKSDQKVDWLKEGF